MITAQTFFDADRLPGCKLFRARLLAGDGSPVGAGSVAASEAGAAIGGGMRTATGSEPEVTCLAAAFGAAPFGIFASASASFFGALHDVRFLCGAAAGPAAGIETVMVS